MLLHDVGTLLVGLLLLGAGVLCQIRSTTLTGVTALFVYLASLVMLIHLPDQLQTISVYMMLGGGTFFTLAILLSIHRDRLLTLPAKIQRGDGLFRVLKWR